MPGMKRRFSELNRFRVGTAGLILGILILLIAINSGSVVSWLTSSTYTADFAEVGGLRVADDVRVAGIKVGEVNAISLERGQVVVKFTVRHSVPFGSTSTLAVKSQDVLGRMYLQLNPSGPRTQDSNTEVPVGRTRSPYDLNAALSDLGNEAAALDTRQLAGALDAVSGAFQNTPTALSASIAGLNRLSATIDSRDATIRQLLTHTNNVTGVLDQRKSQLTNLFAVGNTLLSHFNDEHQAIVDLLRNVSALSRQLSGLVDDNQDRIGPVLHALNQSVDALNANANNVQGTIDGLRRYATQLGDAIGSGPFFQGYIQNLAPTNLAPVLPGLLGKPQR